MGLPPTALPSLPDHLRPGLAIVFIGINPGEHSARAGHYYANPRNPFWRLLHLSGLTPRELRPDEDHLLLAFGYGITDIVKRPSRGLADLTVADFRAGREVLQEKLLICGPRFVCFNSRSASTHYFAPAAPRRYGRQALHIGTAKVFVMPSTSPAHAAVGLARKLHYFRALRRWRDEIAGTRVGAR